MVKSQRTFAIAVLTVVACAVFGTTAFGQSEESSQPVKNSLRDSKSALLFEIIGDFDLTSFEGANLSYKHHDTDNRAYRIGVGVSVSHQNGDDDASGSRWNEFEQSRESISLTALKLYYRNIHDRGGFYWGLGPRIDYSHYKNTRDTPEWDDDYSTESIYDDASAGVVWVFGVEWFLAREFSLLAQYGTMLDYSWSKVEEKRTYVDPDNDYFFNRETSTIRLQADAVRFGVSLYW